MNKWVISIAVALMLVSVAGVMADESEAAALGYKPEPKMYGKSLVVRYPCKARVPMAILYLRWWNMHNLTIKPTPSIW